jgi:hypothetical protein
MVHAGILPENQKFDAIDANLSSVNIDAAQIFCTISLAEILSI